MSSINNNLLTTLLFLLATLAIFAPVTVVVANEEDQAQECPGWAESGECTLNPTYMLTNCAASCKQQAESDREMAAAIGKRDIDSRVLFMNMNSIIFNILF